MLSTLKRLARRSSSAYTAPVKVIQQSLSVSPAQMAQAAERGIPISSQLLGAENFDDGVVGPITDVPFLMRRGVDASDIFVYQQMCRAKIKDYVNSVAAQN